MLRSVTGDHQTDQRPTPPRPRPTLRPFVVCNDCGGDDVDCNQRTCRRCHSDRLIRFGDR
jgi:hypothetical protein